MNKGHSISAQTSATFAPTAFATALLDQLPWSVILIAAGILTYFALPFEPQPAHIALLLSGAGLVWFFTARQPLLNSGLTCLLLVTVGFAAATYRANSVKTPLLSDTWRGYSLQMKVEEIHPLRNNRLRYVGSITEMKGLKKADWPKRIQLTGTDQGPRFGYGDLLCTRARLKRPPGPVRPGGYDYARKLYFEQIGGSGFALSDLRYCGKATTNREENSLYSLSGIISTVRAVIAVKLNAGLTERQNAIARALIIGEKGSIEEGDLTAVRKAGLGHLLAISGLHMAVFAGTLFLFLRALLALFPDFAQKYPIKKWAAIGALIGGGLYFLISGQSVPTQRAFIMITILFLAILLERPALTLRNVTLAALIIMLLRPESLLSPGFQMSFAAVTALIAAYQIYLKRPERQEGHITHRHNAAMQPLIYLGGILLTSLIASAATAPFAIFHFHQISYMGPLGNLLAIPVFSFLVMPAALATLALIPLGLEPLILPLLGIAIDMLIATAHWTASFEPALFYSGEITATALIFFTMAGLCLSFLKTAHLRLLSLPLLIAGLYTASPTQPPDVWITKEGTTLAIRAGGEQGSHAVLAAPDGRKASYDIEKWLRADGDPRSPAEARNNLHLICDDTACSGRVKGRVITLIKSIAALEEACASADILVYQRRLTRHCKHPALKITRPELIRSGGMTIHIQNETGFIIREINETRRHRLWGGQISK